MPSTRPVLAHIDDSDLGAIDRALVLMGLRDALGQGTPIVALDDPERALPALVKRNVLVLSGDEGWESASFRRFPWDKLSESGCRIVVAGLSAPWAAKEGFPAAAGDFLTRPGVRVGAAEPPSLRALSAAGVSTAVPAASPVLLSRPTRLVSGARALVLVPPSHESGASTWRSYRAFASVLRARSPVIEIPCGTRELGDLGTVGEGLLVVPRHPEMARTAIASARGVVSFRWIPAQLAAAAGVPCVFVADGEAWGEAARDLALPWISPRGIEDPAGLARSVISALETFPRAEVARRVDENGRVLVDFLRSQKLVPAGPRGSDRRRFQAGTISDSRYLPFALGWLENLLAHEGDSVGLHVLALDPAAKAELLARYGASGLTVHELTDLWTPAELPEILGRPIAERAFSSKPRFVARILEQAGGPVVYADSDVYFLEPARDLVSALGDGALLLFPHWNDDFPAARRDGLFNAGMLAAGEPALDFLGWWGARCLDDCRVAVHEGVVGDQAYLDFAPALFDGVKIYRGGDHDVARWNLATLGVRFSEAWWEPPRLADGRAVASYHAAFADGLGLFGMKYAWDQLVTGLTGFHPPRGSPLPGNTLAQQARHWLALSRCLRGWRAVPSPWRGAPPGPAALAFFLRGPGRIALGWAAAVSRWARPLASSRRQLQTRPWPQAQRQALWLAQVPASPRRRAAR